MNLTARIGDSFRSEFSRQGTTAYAIGMLFFLVIGGLVYQGILSQAWGMFVSPTLFMALPFIDNQENLWKKIGTGLTTYAFFYALIFAIPDHFGFLSSRPQLRVMFYVAALFTVGLLQSLLMRRLFPSTEMQQATDAEERSCR